MKIKYNYKIVNVNKEANTMEILYSCKTFGEMTVFAPLPRKNETIDDVVLMYNPTLNWIDDTCERQDVKVGTKGTQEVEVLNPDEPIVEPEEDTEIEKETVNDTEREIVVTVLRELGLIP